MPTYAGGAYVPGADYGANSQNFTNGTFTTPTITNPTVTTGTFTSPTINTPALKSLLISGQGATATLTAAQSGATVLFDRAAGIIYTLPAPQVGLSFTFVVTVSVTSNNHKIITDTGTTLLIGSAFVQGASGTLFSANGTTHIAMTQNGTTTGGLIGTVFSVYCVTSTLWAVEATLLGSGTQATPFATS